MSQSTLWSLFRAARLAMALWFLLAIVVFNVTFDWNTRMAGHGFVASQLIRRDQGRPVQTINDGFRPMVRQAAFDASRWLVVIAAAGAVLAYAAGKRAKLHA
jgi:hypothetical protein